MNDFLGEDFLRRLEAEEKGNDELDRIIRLHHQIRYPGLIPRFTQLLDDALLLVPEGWKWEIRGQFWRLHPSCTAIVIPADQWNGHAYEGATPPLALCIAALSKNTYRPTNKKG